MLVSREGGGCLMVEVGDKVKAHHPYTYRPNGCEKATVIHIAWDKAEDHIMVHLAYDTGEMDSAYLDQFHPMANNNDPMYVKAV